MFTDVSLLRFVYAGALLFIGLASKEILVADPALLVAGTFLIFSYVAVTKLGPSANDFFSTHETNLRNKLLSTLDNFKEEVSVHKEQEEILKLSALVVSAGSKPSSSLFNPELNPYVSGTYNAHLKEDAFFSLAHSDLSILSNNQDKEQQRRLTKIVSKFN
ncbi:MAG: hypothetical protein CMM86_03360 [Rhodovulum sp.]|nr:hypothetical protein [Rhodovulum sp.]|tara:strand:- start:3357 stop:3839 length:483 start_codon:yes stop_codon:yes gene_type:complete